MKQLAILLGLIFLILVGCNSAQPQPSSQAAPAAPEAPVADSRAPKRVSALFTAPSSPGRTADTLMAPSMTARLVPYRSDRFGVSFSYPENLSTPAIAATGFPALKLDLGNGEILIYREAAKSGNSLADLAAANIDANTQASNGRIVSNDLGSQTLGGEAAWAVQRFFDSSAGRFDTIQYFVRKAGFDYRVSCGTRQGPPVVAWGAVEPVCRRILATIAFDP